MINLTTNFKNFEIIINLVKNEALFTVEEINKDYSMFKRVVDANKQSGIKHNAKFKYLGLTLENHKNLFKTRIRWFVCEYAKPGRKYLLGKKYPRIRGTQYLLSDIHFDGIRFWEEDCFILLEPSFQVSRKKLKYLEKIFTLIMPLLHQSHEKIHNDSRKKITGDFCTETMELLQIIAEQLKNQVKIVVEHFFMARKHILNKIKGAKYHHLLIATEKQENNLGIRIRWCINSYGCSSFKTTKLITQNYLPL